MRTIILGSNHKSTANYHLQLNLPTSKLIFSSKQDYTVGHTSIQDVTDYLQLEEILKVADRVYWCHPNVEEFATMDDYLEFVNWLKDYNLKYRNVMNFDSISFDFYKWKCPIKVELNQMVFLGCSFTAGVGLQNPNTKYAEIMAKHYNLKALNLAESGGSNNLIFEKFFQLEMQPEQLIVVQFTLLDRFRYCNIDKKLKNLIATLPEKFDSTTLHMCMLEVYNKDFLFYEFLIKLQAMIRVAETLRLRLIFWLIDYKHPERYSQIDQTYFFHYKQFVPASWLQNFIIDFAADNLHPGPESNKFIAHTLIKYIETVYGDHEV